jgi:hypothetical protein
MKINYNKWAERLTIIIEVMFLLSILLIYFKLQDLYDKYNHIKVDVYEIREEIK